MGVEDRDSRAEHEADQTSIPYRLSFRHRVEGSMPRTSAAFDLLPPSAVRTHWMYALSITSIDGFEGIWSVTNGFASVARTPSGRSATEIYGLGATAAALSKAFSSSRTFPGQS